MERLNLNEGACNHLSVMAPARNGKSGERVMLLAPGKKLRIGTGQKEISPVSRIVLTTVGTQKIIVD
jgi:hypothetical protein